MTRRLWIPLLGLCLVAAAASVGALGAPMGGSSASVAQPQTTPEDFDGTLFRITVYENASAEWTVQHSRSLQNATEEEQFRQFAAEFRDRETSTFTNFRTRAQNLVEFGGEATGREMTATSFSRDAWVDELGQTRGAIEMSFVWTNFAESSDGQVEVGDVFQGGMFVGEGQRLEIHRGPDLAFVDAQPTPDSMATPNDLAASESVTWVGEVRFADQRPFVTFDSRESVADGGEQAADGEQSSQGGDDMTPMLLAGGLLVLVLAGGLAWYTGRIPGGSGTIVDRPSGGAGGSKRSPRSSGGGPGAATATQVPQEDLLSDEDRVLKLLDENGGRMKQVAIVEETEWSKSKVSMLLSDMEDEGQISKLRLGRENIISLAGQEPDAAGSPFEDE